MYNGWGLLLTLPGNYWPPSNVAVSWAPGALFAANVRNYTGWPVDEAKQSSIDSLIAEATSSIIIVATRTSGPTTTTATNTGTQRPQATSTTSARTTTRTGSNGANSNSAGSLQVSAAGLGTALAVFLFTSLW
jgi:hypothetical protein